MAHWTTCVPTTYFEDSKRKNNNDVSNKPRRPQDCIRNIAVIAHVDHGKTTLSDALLNKAGLLHKDRVGDQTTGRSLDTLKDERERGITIKSSAVTLNLQIHEDVLRRNDSKFVGTTGTNDAGSENENPTEVYIGNLPRDVSEEELRDYLIKIGACSVSDVRLNDKRGFALANLSNLAELETILALDGAAEMKGRPLVVEISGEDPMHRLKALCDAGSLDMPTISAKEKDDGYSGMAVWPALGDVIIQAPGKYDTKREARRATSFECLRFFASQKGGHREVSAEDMVEAEARDKETFVEPSSSGIVPLVVNLIDSPGHVEFSAEVSSSLRVSDGALVVVDALEGKAAQTEGVLIQALREGVQPVLMINKVDRLIIDQQLNAEQVFDRMQLVIDDINAFIAIHQREDFPDQRVSLSAGSVCFGSGYFGWACSIESFIPLFQSEGSSEESVRKALSKRETFIKHIVRPILRMHRASGVLPCLKGTDPTPEEAHRKVSGLLSKIPQNKKPVSLLRGGQDAALLDPRKLLKKAMMAWLPAADAIVDMVAAHVPSPVHSQRLRAPLLYSGSLDDPSGQGISSCDCSAPLLVFVSKMGQVDPKNKNLLAFGRVFSGTIRSGDIVRAMRTDNTETEAKVKRILICGIGARMAAVPSAHAGQLIALEGMDHALDKSGTLAIAQETKPIRHMVNSVSPILRYGVKPKEKKQLTKMVSGMYMVVNADATAVFFRDTESGQYILAGTGELHIEVLVSSFLERTGIEVELSEPMVSYRETVQVTSEVALAKSENKHNRVFIKASPLDDGTVEAMASGELVGLDKKSMNRELVHSYGWNSAEASRIWSSGPEPERGNEASDMDNPTCFLVDSTYGIQIPKDARENIIVAFQQVVREGVLVGSRMRGVRFDLVDAKFHSDSVHRRPGSLVPASARAMKGAFLMAKPRLVEPVYRADISGSTGSLNGVYSILGQRSATIVDTSSTPTTETIEASLPVRCSFGLAGALRGTTKSRARCTCVYSGMRLVPETEVVEITRNTRQQKGLAEKEPKAENYIDRL